jgi:3-methyladenine DNA glycosylase Tag
LQERIMPAVPFSTILDTAHQRHGSAAIEARLPHPKSAAELAALPNDRYLSQMSLRIFRAGLKHSLVDAKWPAFEEVFEGFDPHRVRAMSDEAFEKLLGDSRLIRHWGKLKSIRDNAAAMLAITEEFGGVGSWLGTWPGDDIVGLWDALAARFSQMGGNSGPMFLRMVGKDTFVLSPSVIAALKRWEGLPPPKNRKDRIAAQVCFNAWGAESGLPLSQMSLILALSVDD